MSSKNTPDLQDLKAQVIRLATSLGLTTVDEPHPVHRTHTDPEHRDDRPVVRYETDLLTIALAWIAARSARDKALGADLFTDPSWDILLDLYVNHRQRRPVSVTSLSIASQAPATTALRWMTMMEKRGLLMRSSDPNDGRRSFISFTAIGLRKMEYALTLAAESNEKLGRNRLRIVQ